ncbi:nucleotidyltransferase domain-containing protein [Paenibacillus ihumii]|uniref:nucleotidyltransferase domain-containing protein n=1 Tax=Paenibacillus ihumii TaxID=687436 RepID=UPI0006D7F0FA|nr:nucleotidyltransferase domain-containing protein [Paenibacillus ihumii]
MNNPFIQEVIEYLESKYNCHTIILYGSYTSNDYTSESDVDLVCFYDGLENKNDSSILNDKQLDAWIYNSEAAKDVEPFLRIQNGIVLKDEKSLGAWLMEEVNTLLKKGPEQLSSDEAIFLKQWLAKMLSRSLRGDVEGDFRYHWLLSDSLEIYFKIKNLWYLGPKKSLQWLLENDKAAYHLFSEALSRNSSNENMKRLIEHILDA